METLTAVFAILLVIGAVVITAFILVDSRKMQKAVRTEFSNLVQSRQRKSKSETQE